MTAKLLRPDELRKRRDAAWPARIQRGCTSELGGLDGHVCLMSKRGGGCTVQHDSIPGHGQKRIRDPSPCQSAMRHATWAAESLFRWDLSKGPSPDQTKHTTSLVSQAAAPSRRDQLPRKSHAPTGCAAMPHWAVAHWSQHCDACGFFGPPSRPSLALRPRRGPRDDGMDGRDIGQGCQARNAD